ncbi:S-adenosyl-L-methionine-dependent methyltransferase [Spinellus fusiger]|nr:S-adenosyl-L-methionine-dependent methyltransferase [Spinellus fusiger]
MSPRNSVKPSNSDEEESFYLNRGFHNIETLSYWLPNDEAEEDRLNEMHLTMKELFSGNVLPKATKVVDFTLGLKVLDLGCATGMWLLEMAIEYPNSDFHGIDISDFFPILKPENTHFYQMNVLNGLPFEDNTFDFVRLSMWLTGLRVEEWPIFLKEIFRVIKPEGYIQSIENDPSVSSI